MYCRQFSSWLLVIAVLAGCTATGVNMQHPQIDSEHADNLVAKIYIIRPEPVKYKGIADNTISVEYIDQKLLDINEGQYALVKLKPSSGELTTRSETKFTNKIQPIEVTRSRRYKFTAGKTYFIYLNRLNEEFRGIFYDPQPINLSQARQLSEDLSPIGLAQQEPINAIATSGYDFDVSPLEPAFPEKLYPGTPYVIKKGPTYTVKQPPENSKQDNKNEMTFDKAPEDKPSP